MDFRIVLTQIDALLVAVVLTFVTAAIPKLVALISAQIHVKHNALIDSLIAQGVAYFKANEPAFEKQSITLVDFVVAHVQKVLPGVSASQIEPAVVLFLQDLDKSA